MFVIADKDTDTYADSIKQFYDFVEKVRANLSKCLDIPGLTAEERKDILAQEMEILISNCRGNGEIQIG